MPFIQETGVCRLTGSYTHVFDYIKQNVWKPFRDLHWCCHLSMKMFIKNIYWLYDIKNIYWLYVIQNIYWLYVIKKIVIGHVSDLAGGTILATLLFVVYKTK